MVVGNYSTRACWWLTACTQKGEASRTCFLVFSFGVFSHVSSPPSSISPLLLRSPPLSSSLLLSAPLGSFLSHVFPYLFTPLSHPLPPLCSASPCSLLLLSSFPLSSLPHPPLLPFTLLPLSSLSLLSCPAAERLQSEPSHLYHSPPLYNHPQNALMR